MWKMRIKMEPTTMPELRVKLHRLDLEETIYSGSYLIKRMIMQEKIDGLCHTPIRE